MTRLLAAAGALLFCLPAHAIPREDVMVHAKAYAWHPWRCSTANLTASCSTTYVSVHPTGDFLGLPYDWGGYMSLFEFDQQMAQGYGAGSYPADGILACTSGLDCSGFVSKCWDTGHYTTSNLDQISTVITAAELLPGDALNDAGNHVVLFSHLSNGEPVYYESSGYNVHLNTTGGWSALSGYVPRRFNTITGTTAGNPVGTPTNPIVVGAFPYTDSRDTSLSPSDTLDGCAASAATPETGPEYVYQMTFTQPGQLTATVSDGAGVDIDVHLYTSMNTNDCIARNDVTFTQPVDCGTYYVVADTWRNGSGVDLVGPYTLNLSFVPSGGSCGSGPPGYAIGGRLNTSCGYPGDETLPWCNPTFDGSDTCIYDSSAQESFCSKACASMADCAAFPGGCCEEIAPGEPYCLANGWCTPAGPDAGVPDGGPARPDAAAPGPDASAPRPDAASPGPDAASPGPDAATPRPDAASPGPDAASPGPDAATPRPDAASPGLDASIRPDAAAPGADASSAGSDASAPGEDASGVEGSDASSGVPPGLPSGACGCSAPGFDALLGLVALAGLRRRRR